MSSRSIRQPCALHMRSNRSTDQLWHGPRFRVALITLPSWTNAAPLKPFGPTTRIGEPPNHDHGSRRAGVPLPTIHPPDAMTGDATWRGAARNGECRTGAPAPTEAPARRGRSAGRGPPPVKRVRAPGLEARYATRGGARHRGGAEESLWRRLRDPDGPPGGGRANVSDWKRPEPGSSGQADHGGREWGDRTSLGRGGRVRGLIGSSPNSFAMRMTTVVWWLSLPMKL